jgi:methionyl-tRNA formyltransferase
MLASGLQDSADWLHLTIENSDEGHAYEFSDPYPDLIISFLNPYIIPAWLLDRPALGAFNVHPAGPKYPGRDPQHFAFYDGVETAAATLHRMTAKVDSGEIIDIAEAPIDRDKGVMEAINASEHLALLVLFRNLPGMAAGHTEPRFETHWHIENKRARHDFLRMCRIEPNMPAEEVRRRITAFFNPHYRSLNTVIGGTRFVYDPDQQG